MKASRGGPAFSHLFFVDYLLLFAKVDHINCLAIMEGLDCFCTRFGQSASESKSRVYFSPYVDRDTQESLGDILGFRTSLAIGKYLRIPIKSPSSSSQDFDFVLDRVKQKLAGWKANLLSLTGRAILVQDSSAAIPTYVMQCTHLPQQDSGRNRLGE